MVFSAFLITGAFLFFFIGISIAIAFFLKQGQKFINLPRVRR
jgi:hypothetical protein